MEVIINYNGQALSVEVTVEVYEYLDRADHKTENLAHEQRRHWDGREFDEYIAFTEGVGVYSETPEEYLYRIETPAFTPAAAAMAVPADSLGDYAVPRLVDRYLMQAGSDDSSF